MFTVQRIVGEQPALPCDGCDSPAVYAMTVEKRFVPAVDILLCTTCMVDAVAKQLAVLRPPVGARS